MTGQVQVARILHEGYNPGTVGGLEVSFQNRENAQRRTANFFLPPITLCGLGAEMDRRDGWTVDGSMGRMIQHEAPPEGFRCSCTLQGWRRKLGCH